MNWGKIDIDKLRLATPYYLMSENALKKNCKKFMNTFVRYYPKVKAYYSIKTNHELEVLKIIRSMGFGSEISGGLDLFFSKKAGFKPEETVFDGPCKSKEDIEFALKEKVYMFNLDSLNDAKTLSEVCRKKGMKAKAGFRLSAGGGFNLVELLASYKIKKFGMPMNQIKRGYDFIINDNNIEAACVNTYIGTQTLSIKAFTSVLNSLFDLAKYLESKGCGIEEINLGGGFPSQSLVKTTMKNILGSKLGIKQSVPDLSEFAEKIMNIFLDRLSELKSEPYLTLEPGRSIVGNAGIFVTKILDIKDGKWIFIDGSVNHIPESSFFVRRRVVSRPSNETRRFIISGRTLNTADVLLSNVKLPKATTVGDLLFIEDCGAYTISRASQFTLLRPPVYLVKSNNKIKKTRRKENYNDLLRLMR